MKEAGYVVYALYILTMLWMLVHGLMQLHLWWQTRKPKIKTPVLGSGALPFVSIQVPVYNEKYVIEGLLQSLAALDYPAHLFEIQVLDDSNDETSAIIDQTARTLIEKGIVVNVVRRPHRKEYKAGALQYGLPLCKGDLIAIFDADFRPPAHFLKSLIPHFNDHNVGMAQARWTHLNEEQNFLTRIQTFLLDTHFNIEQAGRHAAGYFINFCGTAGIWRRQCIQDAGGWDGSILSEDLDLSYRAQLRGWKLVYDAAVAVPAELPAVLEAFKIQQSRWTKGIAQTARKRLPQIFKSPLSWGKKAHAVFQMLSSFMFVCLLLNALLTLPMLVLRNTYTEFISLTNYTAVGMVNLVLLFFLYYQGIRKTHQKPMQLFKYFPVFLTVYMGMAVQNTVAVLEGFFGGQSPFVRTPKFAGASAKANSYLPQKQSRSGKLERALLLYFLCCIGLSFYLQDYFLLLFFAMMSWGLGILVYQSLNVASLKNIFRKLQWRWAFR